MTSPVTTNGRVLGAFDQLLSFLRALGQRSRRDEASTSETACARTLSSVNGDAAKALVQSAEVSLSVPTGVEASAAAGVRRVRSPSSERTGS